MNTKKRMKINITIWLITALFVTAKTYGQAPQDNGEIITDRFIYFVHGYGGENDSFDTIRDYLLDNGLIGSLYIDYSFFDYFADYPGESKETVHENRSITQFASNFYMKICSDLAENAEIDIIGHSLGGMISREMIRQYKDSLLPRNIIIKKYISLGSPHNGITSFTAGLFGNTKVVLEVKTGSVFLTTLNHNADDYLRDIDVHCAAGNKWFGFSDGIVEVSSALGNWLWYPLFNRTPYVLNGQDHLEITYSDEALLYIYNILIE